MSVGKKITRSNRLFSYGVALLCVALALGISLPLGPLITLTPTSLFFMAVMVSAWYGGLGPGLVATVLSTLVINYCFIVPYYSLNIVEPGSILRLSVFVMAAMLISGLNESRRIAIGREQTLRAVSEAAQSEAQAAKERLETLLSSINDAFFVLDRDWRFTYVNDRLCQMLGMQPEELLGRNNWELFPDTVDTDVHIQFQQALSKQTPVQFEYFYSTWNRWYENKVYPSPTGLTVLVTDITERKQAEVQLQESQHFVQQIAETIPGILYVYDLISQRNRYVNQQVTKLLGYTAEQVQAMGANLLPTLIHPEDFARVPAHIAQFQSAQDSEIFEIEYRMQHANGEWRWFYGREVVFSRTADGAPQRILGICQDITKRKQVEQALWQSEEQLRLASEGANLGLWHWDVQTDTLTWTDQCKALFGLPIDTEMSYQVFLDTLHPEDRQRIHEMQPLLEGGQLGRHEIEYRVVWPDGTVRWIAARGNATYDADGKPISSMGVTFDITDRKQAEIALRESEQRLRLAMEGAQMATWDVDLITGKATWSELHFTMLGYEPAPTGEATEAMWSSRIHPDDMERVIQEWQQSRQERRLYRSEYRVVRVDNQQIAWLAALGSFIYNPKGEAIRSIGVLFDITDRKQAEEALRQRETELRLVTNAVPALISFVDSDQRYRFNNRAYEEWFGHPAAAIYGKTLWEVLGEPAYEAIRPYVEQVLAGEQVTYESQVPYKNAGNYYISATYIPRFDAQGQVEGFVALVCDMSERKQAQEALRDSEERLNIAIQGADLGTWDYDLISGSLIWSDRCKAIFGLSPETELSYTVFLNAVHPEDRQQIDQAVSQAIAQQQDYDVEMRTLELNGTVRWVRSIGKVSRNLQGTPIRMAGVALDISDLKQTEKALSVAIERFELAANAVNCLVYEWNIEQNTVERTEGLSRILGYSLDEADLSADWWFDLYHPEDKQRIRDEIASAWATSDRFSLEYRLRHKNGHYVHVLDQAIVVQRDANGKPIRQIGSTIDVSERKQAEMALRDSEEQFRNMADHAPFMVWVTDSTGYCTYLSQSWYDFTGQTPETGLGLRWLNAVHPDNQEYARNTFLAANERHEAFRLEYRLRRKDDEYIWVIDAATPWFGGDGQYKGYVGSVIDISDRKQAELEREHLLTRERYYVKQLQGLTTAALAINSALSVEQVLQVITDQAASIIGAHQSVTIITINHNWTQAITTVYLSDKYAQWRDYHEKPDGSGIYACVCHLNRPMRMTQAELEAHPRWRGFGKEAQNHPPMRGWLAAPLMERDGKNIGLIQLSDKYEGEFTEADEAILVQLAQMASVAIENARLYEAEQQARSAAEASREEAHAANRVKDEFLAVLSHELRSPLNPILGWSKLLLNGKLDEVRTKQALATIERNAKLQAELIEDLLDVSRILRGKLSLTVNPINLASTIKAAIETVRLAAEAKSIRIEVMLDPEVGKVSGDSTRLQQVVWNLLSNAVKFTPAGGQVEIRLEQVDHQAQITVSDTGKGISPNFLPHVFDYFRQADSTTTRKFGGLGLGLAIVRHLVELHGGTVEANSQGEGMGATFTVKIPLMPTQPSVNQDSQLSEPSLDLNGIQILVVDDDTDTRDFVAFLLEQAGARVTAVTTAGEAFAALTRSQPDVLLSDIGMPQMDGYMLIRQVRALPPEQGGQVKAIALTAYAGDFNQQQALQAGFQRHIAKPIKPQELIKAIASLLRFA